MTGPAAGIDGSSAELVRLADYLAPRLRPSRARVIAQIVAMLCLGGLGAVLRSAVGPTMAVLGCVGVLAMQVSIKDTARRVRRLTRELHSQRSSVDVIDWDAAAAFTHAGLDAVSPALAEEIRRISAALASRLASPRAVDGDSEPDHSQDRPADAERVELLIVSCACGRTPCQCQARRRGAMIITDIRHPVLIIGDLLLTDGPEALRFTLAQQLHHLSRGCRAARLIARFLLFRVWLPIGLVTPLLALPFVMAVVWYGLRTVFVVEECVCDRAGMRSAGTYGAWLHFTQLRDALATSTRRRGPSGRSILAPCAPPLGLRIWYCHVAQNADRRTRLSRTDSR